MAVTFLKLFVIAWMSILSEGISQQIHGSTTTQINEGKAQR